MTRAAVLCISVLLSGAVATRAQHAAKAGAGDATAGEAVFQRNCVMCHSVTQDVKIVGPSLYSVMRGPHAHKAAEVHEIVVKGKGQMPAMGDRLSEQELTDLMAYLRKL